MFRKMALATLAMATLTACGGSLREHANVSSVVEAESCRSRAYPGPSSYVVEGFGSRHETQLIVTERRPVSSCLEAGASRGGALSAVE